jgi:hypothetical protein
MEVESRPRLIEMRKLWFALLFLAGGISHEIRNPVGCHCITTRQSEKSPERSRKR